MKKFGVIKHVSKKKVTTIGNSHRSKRRHGVKNRQKKFSCDNISQGR